MRACEVPWSSSEASPSRISTAPASVILRNISWEVSWNSHPNTPMCRWGSAAPSPSTAPVTHNGRCWEELQFQIIKRPAKIQRSLSSSHERPYSGSYMCLITQIIQILIYRDDIHPQEQAPRHSTYFLCILSLKTIIAEGLEGQTNWQVQRTKSDGLNQRY